MRDALFAPSRVLQSHLANQGSHLAGHRRSPRPGRELPIEPKALPVPANQRRRLDDDERLPPIESPGQPDQSRTRGVIRPPRLDLSLLKQSQLFAQEEVLRRQ